MDYHVRFMVLLMRMDNKNTPSGIQLEKAYQERKAFFHHYIDEIKQNIPIDIFSVINITLIKNPYDSNFSKKFFLKEFHTENRLYLFIQSSFKFYLKNFYYFLSYLISFTLFKIFYKKKRVDLKSFILIDIFFIVENIIKSNKFDDNYFMNLYDVLDKYNCSYVFLPRLYGSHKNPFKLIKIFTIINRDKRNFLFEFELLSFADFISIFLLILQYPFKTLRLIQKETTNEDVLFNNELIKDIHNLTIDAFTRYQLGKNISRINGVSKIYSWSEFQVIERSFNYGVRTQNENIRLYGCQFYLNYETYFNTSVDDIDFIQKTSFHEVLVNSKYYLLDRKQVIYKTGVSLRYQKIFLFNKTILPKNVILLGTFFNEAKYMLESVSNFELILFKNHPIVEIKQFGKLKDNIKIVNDDIYTLFENASVVICVSSGTAMEAVACGIPVIIIASHDNLTAHPLVQYGKGEIWDIAFSKDDVTKLYNKLTQFKNENRSKIQEIAAWYKDNFFIEPTEKNIAQAFDLDKE
jgi:hypothetical protein